MKIVMPPIFVNCVFAVDKVMEEIIWGDVNVVDCKYVAAKQNAFVI